MTAQSQKSRARSKGNPAATDRGDDRTPIAAPPEPVAEPEVAAEEESRFAPHGSTCVATCEGGDEAPHHARTYTFEALAIDDATLKVTAELWTEQQAVLLSIWNNSSDQFADVSLSLLEAQDLIDFLQLAISRTLWDHWQQQTGYGAPSIQDVA